MKRIVIIFIAITMLLCASIIIFTAVFKSDSYDITKIVADKGSSDIFTTQQLPLNSEKEERNTMKIAGYEKINNDKNDLIEKLHENYDVFVQIAGYLENSEKEYHCKIEDGELVIRINNETNHPSVDISEVEVSNQIAYVLNDLGFQVVSSYEDCILFGKNSGILINGGTYIQDLFYNKRNAREEKKIVEGTTSLTEKVRIRDEWFYVYMSGYNDVIS